MKSSILLAAATTMAFALPSSAAPQSVSFQQFGKCAADKYEGAELLATQPGSAEEAEVIAEYGRRSCTPPVSDPGAIRGAVAEQLFKSDFGSIGAAPRREVVEIFTVDMNELGSLDDNAKKRIDSVAFGTCVAASDPDKSTALLKTAAGSAEEKEVMNEMVPKFAPCINAGERFALSKTSLRSALAEGAYRLALSETLDEEVVVTGTHDRSKSVQCKQQSVSGTRLRRTICLTEAQWAIRERNQEYEAKDAQRQAREYEERVTTCIRMSLFGEGGAGAPCLMR